MRQMIALGLVLFLCRAEAAWALNGKAGGHAAGLRYQVSITGMDDPELSALLFSVSSCAEQQDKPVASAFRLRARAKADVPALRDALKSRGRFAAQVSFSVDEAATPVRVLFAVSSAEPFLLEKVDVVLAGGAGAPAFPLPGGRELGLVERAPAISKEIVSGANTLLSILQGKGHPFPVLAGQRVVADFETHLVRVTYTVDPGPRADFGPVRFSGLKGVEESFLRPLVPWKEGDEYRQELVARFQDRLLSLGLFATAAVAPRKSLDENGRVVVEATVTERKMRTIKAGINYKTDEGPGANAFWEHRNLFGQAEKLRLSLAVSQINQTFEAAFEKPSFFSPKQKFLSDFKSVAENTQAYKGQNATLQAGLSRELTEHLTATAGVGYRASRIEEDAANPQENSKRWGLAFIPLELALNTRDDPMDPKKGYLVGVKVAPYLDTLGNKLDFLKAELSAAAYLSLLSKPPVILAARAGLGSINGAQARDIPPDVRFYAGGSATVRGYAYQLVGPLRGNSKPLGGNSIFDFGSELRVQVTERIGIVGFLDGGNVYDKQYPALNEGMRYGAGLGVRVKTPVGPLRLDAATPLNPRPNVDGPFQFYIGLGQAF
ncbi:autotransporter assembly complex protein TamA [Fundidesulfovibrio terrae]|uniref:autotransporter assembly complex protein TamA n=1 Tax=Fundidesulfovibrio terrae TaxID=2922866 RepID=UPI001FAF0018|nr:autotransporter assembly complex family protein [Fundidesulfovibrio terrae]